MTSSIGVAAIPRLRAEEETGQVNDEHSVLKGERVDYFLNFDGLIKKQLLLGVLHGEYASIVQFYKGHV